jgi:hypothetical protein
MRAPGSLVPAVLGALALATLASPSSAQDALHDTAVLHGGLFTNAQGNVAVNAAAGVNNQQANVAVVSEGEVAVGSASLIQWLETTDGAGDRLASAQIIDDAFANSSGLIAVNVAAGADNQQGNVAVITLAGSGVMSDVMLSQSRATRGPQADAPGPAEAANGQTLLAPGAFENSSGIVQVSLIGGERNASSNLFALSVQGGAKP